MVRIRDILFLYLGRSTARNRHGSSPWFLCRGGSCFGHQVNRPHHCHGAVRGASSLAGSTHFRDDAVGSKGALQPLVLRFPTSAFDSCWNSHRGITSLLVCPLLHPSALEKRGLCELAIVRKDSELDEEFKEQPVSDLEQDEGVEGSCESSTAAVSDTDRQMPVRKKKLKKIPHEKTTISVITEMAAPDFSDATKVFQSLLASKNAGNMPISHKERLHKFFRLFSEGGWARTQASALFIRPSFFPTASSRFKKFFMHRCYRELRLHVLKLSDSEGTDSFLFSVFSEYCKHEFAAEIERYRSLVSTADLTKPHTWYPFARAFRRKLVYHCGPTNSGKTYSALKRFMEASTGIYCSPLRLLAMEVFEKVNADGIYCSLITGQERKEVPFSQHLACTIEMASTQQSWEVAVIDEIQMITDEFRGWAWTRAFLGLQADEVHLCGDPSALALIQNLCASTGDVLEEITYERFKPLLLDCRSLEGNIQNVQRGDCIVAFSRSDIFYLKQAIEKATPNRCCVVYGGLPPETRTEQARLFNDPSSGFDVLVASDAVGMGLNLNIRRIVFYSVNKFNGDTKTLVSASQIKQIAGRAGRMGSLFPEGMATTFFASDVPYLAKCLKAPYDIAQSAGLFPALEQIELFANQLPDVTLSQLLDRFSETSQLDGSYFLCRNDQIKKVALVIGKIKGLSMEDRFTFCFAPVNTRDPKVMVALFQFATAYSEKMDIPLLAKVPSRSARDELELQRFETQFQILSLYLWLSQHFPEEFFPERERAERMTADIAVLLGESLAQTNFLCSSRKQIPSSKSLKKGRLNASKALPSNSAKHARKTSKVADVFATTLRTRTVAT